MSDLVTNSLSGLRASVASFSAAASNIANLNDVGPVPATPPSEPVPQNPGGTQVYQPIVAVPSSTGASPGVASTYAPQLPSYSVAYDPAASAANDKGEVALPNVNLAEELVKIAMAVQAFRANIAVMKAANQMSRSALNILT